MIVGTGLDGGNGEPVWPKLELLEGDYHFTFRGDDDKFLGKMAKFDFEHFMSWLKNRPSNDFTQDTFDLNPQSFSDIVNAMDKWGCPESRAVFSDTMHRYYDDNNS